MNITELLNLTTWIQQEIVANKILDKYQGLYSALVHVRNRRVGQNYPPFETKKNDLIKALKSIKTNNLTQEQLAFLTHLNIGNYIGKNGVDNVENIFHEDGISVPIHIDKIQHIIRQIDTGINKSNNIKKVLSDCPIQEYELENEVLMRVYFSNNSGIANVTDFKHYGKDWHDIGRGIAMVFNKAPEDIKIVGANKGSVVLDFSLLIEIAGAFATIVFGTLKVIKDVYDIKIKRKELEHLNLDNTIATDALSKNAEKRRKDGVKIIMQELIEKHKLDVNAEQTKTLENSVKKLLNFTDNGGSVDFIEPISADNESVKNLEMRDIVPKIRQLAPKVRELEQKVRLLENKQGQKQEE